MKTRDDQEWIASKANDSLQLFPLFNYIQSDENSISIYLENLATWNTVIF